METVAAAGLAELMKLGAVVVILLLVILVLVWFIKVLLQDAKEERKLSREALNNSTAVLAELKELIRSALAR